MENKDLTKAEDNDLIPFDIAQMSDEKLDKFFEELGRQYMQRKLSGLFAKLSEGTLTEKEFITEAIRIAKP